MQPVVTVEEMRAVDAAALEHVSHHELVTRAGSALARTALGLLGGAYGRRVVVVAGKGDNGNDGRVCADRLRQRGVRVTVVDAADARDHLGECDLVVDAAYGTGFRGRYAPPDPGPAPVLAADIPSGVDGDIGLGPDAVWAGVTVTFGALKPGLLLGDGRLRAGVVLVEPIGLGADAAGRATIHLVDDADVALPGRPAQAHKWQTAVQVVAGSPGMSGAATFVTRAALRSGAGYVRLASPGVGAADLASTEAVGSSLPATGWAEHVLRGLDRVKALAVGPGLGRGEETVGQVRALLARAPVPAVVDADGLNAIGSVTELRRLSLARPAPTVVTPHDGEFARLTGSPPGADRIGAARELAHGSGAVVLLKGTTTVVAAPDGQVRLVTAGSSRLATAGTGDVLCGVIAAFLARGMAPLDAASVAAHAHGRAATMLGRAEGLVAGDLPDLVSDWLCGVVMGPDGGDQTVRTSDHPYMGPSKRYGPGPRTLAAQVGATR